MEEQFPKIFLYAVEKFARKHGGIFKSGTLRFLRRFVIRKKTEQVKNSENFYISWGGSYKGGSAVFPTSGFFTFLFFVKY